MSINKLKIQIYFFYFSDAEINILRHELGSKIAEIKLCNEAKLNMCHEIDTLKAQVSTLRGDLEISSEIKIEPPFSDILRGDLEISSEIKIETPFSDIS